MVNFSSFVIPIFNENQKVNSKGIQIFFIIFFFFAKILYSAMINQSGKQCIHDISLNNTKEYSDLVEPNINNKNNLINGIYQNSNNFYFLNKFNGSANILEQKRKIQKNIFSIQEDTLLISLVDQMGDKNWLGISKKMKEMNYDRNSRQCRDRYMHYLDPKMHNDVNWSPEEDDLLLLTVEKYGNKWKYMESLFAGRSEVSLRNRYRKLQRKKSKEERKGEKKKKNIMSDSFSFLDDIKTTSKKRSSTVKNKEANKPLQKNNFQKNCESKKIKNNVFSQIFNDTNLFTFCDDDDLKYMLF